MTNSACKLPKVTKPEIKPLEPEELARLHKEAEKDDYCNLFLVAMNPGGFEAQKRCIKMP